MIAPAEYRVLIIEDDLDTRAALSDVLELDGYEVVGVGTAKESLAQDCLSDYAAIILDRRLPDGCADELLPKLRVLAPDASFIIATGQADLNGTISALRAGASDYILKPINPVLLRASLLRLRQLRQAEQRARQAERLAAIGQMVTTVAHESRNALQRIQARAELMRLSLEDRPDLLEDLDAIEKANDGLRCLFEELREYSAPIVLDRRDVDVATLVQQAWNSLRHLPAHHQATFRIDSIDACMCRVDMFRIEQVFRNLFENALAAIQSRAEIAVTMSAASGVDSVEIKVTDNGPGFSEEQRHKAFEPFYTTKSRGTGLGLAITKRIVDAHAGGIDISPSSAKGGEIVISLPRTDSTRETTCVIGNARSLACVADDMNGPG